MKKALLSVALLVLFLLASFLAAPETILTTAHADCLGPNPTATIQPSYADKVLNTQSGHLIAYWKLDETSGTTATDSSGNGRNGTYSGVGLNSAAFVDGSPAGSWDGVNDFVNVYSSSLNTAYNGSEGSLVLWAQVSTSGVWTDSTLRYFARFRVNASNYVAFFKSSVSNRIDVEYVAGGTGLGRTKTSYSPTSWFQPSLSWSKSDNQVHVYLNGVQEGATLTGLGSYTGSLASSESVLGAGNNAGNSPFQGHIAHVALWDTPLNATEVALLATVEPIVPTATPWPTCTPSPTPTYTPTPTFSPSPTPTITPTYSLYSFMTVVPPGGTLSDARPASFKYEITAGQVVVAALIFALLVVALLERAQKARGR